MKSFRFLSRFAPLLAFAVAPLLGGCIFIHAPTAKPIPTTVPTPFGVQFDPSEGTPKGTALNNQAGATVNLALPDSFRVALIASGQELVLQSVKKIAQPSGTPQIVLGPADTLNPVRLAGILVPTGNATGAGEAVGVLQTWLSGQDLDVDIDPVFPTDTDNKRRVQVYFTARTAPYTGQRMSLNRMMVRSGYAIVDLNSPTSFDQSQWLYDETFARENELGLWKTDTFRRLQQRVKLPSSGTGAKSSVGLQLPKPGDAPASALVVPGAPAQTTTTTTTTSSQAAPQSPQAAPTDPAAAGMPKSPLSPAPPAN